MLLILFFIFNCFCLYKLKFSKNKDYIDYKQTNAINGYFVIVIFLSHFSQYINLGRLNYLDRVLYYKIIFWISQLMVTTFLFYSGYGILCSIMNKNDYIKDFLKHRFFKVLLSFDTAILIYLIYDLITEFKFSISTLLLSFIGYDSIGNSNWFIFVTLVLYLATYAAFKVFNKATFKAILSITVLNVIYIVALRMLKGPSNAQFYNTAICYSGGMWYAYYKVKIDEWISDNRNYFMSLIVSVIIFFIIRKFSVHLIAYELMSNFFVFIIVLLSMRIKFSNKLLIFFGKHIFSIYVLQRIPMNFFALVKLNQINLYLYFIVTFISTIILAIIFDFFMKKLNKIIFK